MHVFLLFCSALLGTCLADMYDGYIGIVAGPMKTKQQLELVDSLRDEDSRTRKVIILQDYLAVDHRANLVVSPERAHLVKTALSRANIPFEIASTDVGKSHDEEKALNAEIREKWLASDRAQPPEYYMEWDEQLAYIQQLAADSSIAEYTSLGDSHNGREMPLVTINGDRSDLPGVWVDSGIHCREWISQATLIHVLETILTDNSAEAVDLRDNYRIYIAPNLNPDGYLYTWTDDRYWRKNRSNNGGCGGVDLNRNFDVNYDNCGTSSNPCSDTYSGPGPASEVETQVVVDQVKQRQNNEGGIEIFISIHAYAQFWLIPWGGSEVKPADYNDLLAAAEEAVAAIESVNGLAFVPGTVPDLLYCAAGGSFDWAKNDGNLPGDGAGIKYAYTPELRPEYNCCGLPGFDPHPSNIDPSGRETFAGIYANVKAVA